MIDVTVRIEHVRSALLCTGGARRWFRARGLDWSKFLSEGLPASVIGQWGDPLAAKAIAAAEEEASNVG